MDEGDDDEEEKEEPLYFATILLSSHSGGDGGEGSTEEPSGTQTRLFTTSLPLSLHPDKSMDATQPVPVSEAWGRCGCSAGADKAVLRAVHRASKG